MISTRGDVLRCAQHLPLATLFRAFGAGLGDIRSITDLDAQLHFKLESTLCEQEGEHFN